PRAPAAPDRPSPAGWGGLCGRGPAAGRRLPDEVVQRVSVARARGAPAHVPAADARVPLGDPPAEGRPAEPAVGRGGLWEACCVLQVGACQATVRPLPVVPSWRPDS